MYQAQFNITKSAYQRLSDLTKKLGKQESEIVNMAILEFNPGRKENNRLKLLQKARGIWKDRTDLPTPDELRDDWERNVL